MSMTMQRDCSTCAYRNMPDDVDWTKEPCESCVLLHISKSKTPWPYWSQRTPSQFRDDAKAGYKVRIVMQSTQPE